MRKKSINSLVAALSCALIISLSFVSSQLPADMQRELNQNLEQQARLQALRHQQQLVANQNRAHTSQQQPHDPNNYSYEQMSPPIQYSYYQPFGDAAKPQQAQQQQKQQANNFDLNNLNFDIPQQQQQQQQPANQQSPVSSFGGSLPVAQARVGQQAAPQVQAQQGPSLTEADFRGITEGQNYGTGLAGLTNDNSSPNSGAVSQPARRMDNTDAQLAAMGLGPDPRHDPHGGDQGGSVGELAEGGVPDFGAFGFDSQPQHQMLQPQSMFGGFGGQGGGSPGSDFDFASQPSSSRAQDRADPSNAGVAPSSLQKLLGSSFPGLAGGAANTDNIDNNNNNNIPQDDATGLNDFARGDPQTQRNDDGAMDIADMGDRSDQFSGTNLGSFEQPLSAQDNDFNLMGNTNTNANTNNQRQSDPFAFEVAAAEPQPSVVPYPDGGPQPVGTLFALTQPQSLSQARYSPLLDKGTYQQYPSYDRSDGLDARQLVRAVVDSTPAARAPALGRYGWVPNGGS